MTITANDIVTSALRELGILAAGETSSAADAALGLEKLNDILDAWKTKRLYCYQIASQSFPFAVSQETYTIGKAAGADFDYVRPVRLENYCNLILVGTTNLRVPLPVIQDEDWSSIAIPALSSTIPTKVYYQPTWPNGTLYPWPYPTDVSNEIELFMWLQIGEFTAVTDTFTLPPGYRLALKMSLAEALCSPFGKSITPEIADQARKARANITGLNAQSPRQMTDVPGITHGGGMQWDPQIRGWR